MLTALIAGRLVRDPKTQTGVNGKSFSTAIVRVSCETFRESDADHLMCSVIAFGEAGETLAKLKQGDDISIAGAARLSFWSKDGQPKNGLSITAARVMSAYERREKQKVVGDQNGGAT